MPYPHYRKYYLHIFYLQVFLLYVLYPSFNNTTDALAYAAQVKYSQELFQPHHLLYDAFMWLLYKTAALFAEGIPVMGFMIFINALAAVASLWILGQVLSLLGANAWRKLALLAVAAFSFGFWRFAAENETYILPLLFSLTGSYFYISYSRSLKYAHILWSGLFAALAMLFHQVHIFWWLGLLAGLALIKPFNFKAILAYILPVCLVPLAYILVLTLYYHQPFDVEQLLYFITHDVQEGNAGQAFELKFLFIGAASFIRTFVQVHGLIFLLLKKYFLSWLVVVVSAGLFAWAGYKKVKSIRNDNWSVQHKDIFRTHLVIFLLQLGFAIYAGGNAEFMVMLPSLIVIALASWSGWPVASVALAAGALLIWNFFLGIWPQHELKLAADDKIAEWSIAHPEAVVVAAQFHTVSNYAEYYLKGSTNNMLKGPSYYVLRGESTDGLKNTLDDFLANGKLIYTDCTGRPELLNRAAVMLRKSDKEFFASYKLMPVDSFATDAGYHVIYQLK